MTKLNTNKKSLFIIFFIVSMVFISVKCINHDNHLKEDQTSLVYSTDHFKEYAGTATCAGCHKDIYEKHIHTAHFLTSQPAIEKYIKGSFIPGQNSFPYDQFVKVDMEKRDSGFYQVEYYKGMEKISRKIDIVVGSGNMGQSFLNWRGNRLFQMPITYFTDAGIWSNSPGYPDKVIFNRTITTRCLECHTTYAKTITPVDKEPEQFDHQKMIYAVTCEKCHGPAQKHVEYESLHANEKIAKFIINPAHLTRIQQMEMCGLCHGGRLQKTKPSFEFTPGDKLADFFVMDTTPPNPDNIDVHANQFALLRASKCYRMSNTLTCNSCHNTHENERGKIVIFSQRCMSCHSQKDGTFCKLAEPSGLLKRNCIDCHMPVKLSHAIAVMLPGSTIPTAAKIRSHYITLYPDETNKILAFLKK